MYINTVRPIILSVISKKTSFLFNDMKKCKDYSSSYGEYYEVTKILNRIKQLSFSLIFY